MAVEAISTAGLKVLWAAETSVGSRPQTSYKTLDGVKALPAFGDSVNTLQTTNLAQTVCHTYIPGLADSGGSMQLTVNDAPLFRTSFDSMYSAYVSAHSAGKGFWLQYQYPSAYGMSAFYVPVTLAPLGFGGATVDAVLENNVNVIPTGDFLFAAAST